MATELYCNNAIGVLNGAITSGATTLVITAQGNFPVTSTGQFRIKIDNEYILVTNSSTTTWTIVRGIEGSTPASHIDQSGIYGVLTDGSLRNLFSTLDVIVTATDGSTVTFDLSLGNKQIVTLGGNRTLALTNDAVGRIFTIILKQDATGSRTVTWFAGVLWSNGLVPTLSTNPNIYDVFTFIKISSAVYLGSSSMPDCH